ncbi:MAG: hypothetical protein E7546_05590 [Ruminococcaceae bacterium]|nr:hypothetical protein [Oscillospiraceae bacterium]
MKKIIETLYGNIGKKIMTLALILNAVLLVGGIIAAFVALFSEAFELIIPCLLIAFVPIIPLWFMYAFGKMVDDLDAIRSSIVNPSAVNDNLFENRKSIEKSQPSAEEIDIEKIDTYQDERDTEDFNDKQEMIDKMVKYSLIPASILLIILIYLVIIRC